MFEKNVNSQTNPRCLVLRICSVPENEVLIPLGFDLKIKNLHRSCSDLIACRKQSMNYSHKKAIIFFWTIPYDDHNICRCIRLEISAVFDDGAGKFEERLSTAVTAPCDVNTRESPSMRQIQWTGGHATRWGGDDRLPAGAPNHRSLEPSAPQPEVDLGRERAGWGRQWSSGSRIPSIKAAMWLFTTRVCAKGWQAWSRQPADGRLSARTAVSVRRRARPARLSALSGSGPRCTSGRGSPVTTHGDIPVRRRRCVLN